MTVRQYFDDSYATCFEANVIERLKVDNKPAIILDRTNFYPSSGGQPHDLGTIQGIEVIDVAVRESDRQILHVLSEVLSDTEIIGEIEWARRFDHMQQHSGQHTLSQAFIRIAKADTISFHLSRESSTLDLATDCLPEEKIEEVELFANSIVWQNRPILIKYGSAAETYSLPLRKTPDKFGEKLRLIEIEDFDLSACGGTHVSRTGEIGLIKVTKTERRSNGLRVEFRCGERALHDYQQKSRVVSQLMIDLTTGAKDLPDAVHRLSQELRSTNRQLKRQTKQLVAIESGKLYQEGVNLGPVNLICRIFENRDPAEIRALVKDLVSMDNTVVLFGVAGPRSQLIFAMARNLRLNMDVALQQALPELGNGSGGGNARFAQGGGTAADKELVAAALDKAELYLRQHISVREHVAK